jgi:hypothetical protein
MSKKTRPYAVAGTNRPIIMEVIGEDGLKVGEYVDKRDKPLPYHILQERYVNDV